MDAIASSRTVVLLVSWDALKRMFEPTEDTDYVMLEWLFALEMLEQKQVRTHSHPALVVQPTDQLRLSMLTYNNKLLMTWLAGAKGFANFPWLNSRCIPDSPTLCVPDCSGGELQMLTELRDK